MAEDHLLLFRNQRRSRSVPSDLSPKRRWLALSIVGIALNGCVTHRQLIDQARIQYWQGDFANAQSSLEHALKRPKRDADVLKLDQAMVCFNNGELAKSASLLREVRDQFDSPDFGITAQNAAAYLTDDNTRPYSGEDHEKILIRVLLTLIDLVEGNGDGIAFAHQLGTSIDEMLASRATKNPEVENKKVAAVEVPEPGQAEDVVVEELAIAPLLRALVRKSSRLNQDDVIRNLKLALEWRATSPFLMHEFLEVSQHHEPPPGFGQVYVVALIGRGPVKEQTIEPATSQALLVADQILSALGEYTLPPTIAPVKIATIVPSYSNVDGLSLSVGSQSLGTTETVTDINRLAVARQQELMSQIIARAVVRRVVKKSMIVATKAKTNVESDLVSNAFNALGVLWEASEQADLRGWSLLPGQIQIARVDLPIGTHELTLTPMFQGRIAGGRALNCQVHVGDGQSGLVLCSIGDNEHVGRVYCNSK